MAISATYQEISYHGAHANSEQTRPWDQLNLHKLMLPLQVFPRQSLSKVALVLRNKKLAKRNVVLAMLLLMNPLMQPSKLEPSTSMDLSLSRSKLNTTKTESAVRELKVENKRTLFV